MVRRPKAVWLISRLGALLSNDPAREAHRPFLFSNFPLLLLLSPFFLSCTSFFPSNPPIFLIPQISAQNGCHRPLCPPFRFSHALAEAPHCAHVARNGFPAGKHPELLAKRILYVVPNISWKCHFKMNTKLIGLVLFCSAGKEVH